MPMGIRLKLFFRTIISVNQLSIYGAVSDVWGIQYLSNKNGETRIGRTIWPIVRASKLIDNDFQTFDWSSCTRKFIAKVQRTNGKALTTRSRDKDLYWCRIPENSWSRTVLHDKGHWRVLTIYRFSGLSRVHFAKRWKTHLNQKVRFKGTPQLGPVLEVTTSFWQGKYGVEIRIGYVNKENSHSWVRNSHGLNKLVTDLLDKEYDDNEQETSETKTEAFALKTDVLAFARRSKANAKTKKIFHNLLIFKDYTYSWKSVDWYWTRSSIQSGVPSGKKTEHSSSAWTITSRRRWSDWILEIKRLSSERSWALSILVWWCMEEQNGRRRRQQEKSSILCWLVRTRNSSSPSSSRSFRTQSHWSHTAGQCVDSEQFLWVHLSYWMCILFTLHHKFRIGSGTTKFKQRKTDGILHSRESHELESQRSARDWLDQATSCIVQAKVEKAQKTRCTGSIYSLLNGKDWSSIKQGRTQSSYTIHSQLIVSRKLLCWNLEKSYISFKDNWMERIGFRSSWKQQGHPTNPTKTKNPIIKNGETRGWTRFHPGDRERYLVWSRGHQAPNKNGETRGWTKIHPELCVNACTNRRQWRRRRSTKRCVLTPKHVEDDQTGTERPVLVDQKEEHKNWFQSTRIVTCSCERSRTFPHSRAR